MQGHAPQNGECDPNWQSETVMAGKRPDWVKPPAHLSESPPVPEPDTAPEAEPKKEHGGSKGPDPTRYGDWEGKGIARDF